MNRLVTQLKDLVETGVFAHNLSQIDIAEHLDGILEQLEASAAHHPKKRWSKFLRRASKKPPVKGLYIHGDVGRGKTFLMDLFYTALTTPQKKRQHFHGFMKEMHQHLQRKEISSEEARGDTLVTGRTIDRLAQKISRETPVLCFDEFFVDHIADAMLLKNLFDLLFQYGCTVIMTSNVAPDDLYMGGFQRELFLPFIPTLKQYLTVVELKGTLDYRTVSTRPSMEGTGAYQKFFQQHDASPDGGALRALYVHLTGESPLPGPDACAGRPYEVLGQRDRILYIDFKNLCEVPTSSWDYLTLAQSFDVWLLANVPALSTLSLDASKRFQSLIDVLYDAQKTLYLETPSSIEEFLTLGPIAPQEVSFKRTFSRLKYLLGI